MKNNLKKYQLLEKAMQDYPAGTVAQFNKAVRGKISDGTFKIIEDREDGVCVCNNNCDKYFYVRGEWAVPVPASILTGKFAIAVNNEREFKLLMEHYESKRWVGTGGAPAVLIYSILNNSKFPKRISYHDSFDSYLDGDSDFEREQYQAVTFADFAAELGIKVPVFVMKSEDGVDLYEGDRYAHAYRHKGDDRWSLGVSQLKFTKDRQAVCNPKEVKAFSTKEAAEKWIAEQNKPKEIVIDYDSETKAVVSKSKVVFELNGSGVHFTLTNNHLSDVYAAYKSLQP